MPEAASREDAARRSNCACAPLLIPALIFAAGCSWGAGSPALFWPSLATVALLGALWLRNLPAQRSLLPFLGALFFVGVCSASFHRGWSPADDLRHLPQGKFGADCWWEGTIRSVPVEKEREGERTTTALFTVHRAWLSGGWRSASGRVLLEVRAAPAGGLVLSQRLWVRGALRRPGEPRNPGDPDWREILAVRRVAYRLKAAWSDIRPLNPGSWLGRQIGMARRWASRLLRTGIESDPEAVALLLGMIYGQTGGLPAKTEEDFRLAGAYHVFAVSGQNVGAFLTVGLALLEAGRVSRWRWGWALFPAVAFYAFFSGGSASVGRAALLSSLVLAAWLIRRPVSLLNLWGACLLLFLALDPLSVLDVSLQLSFGVVLALLLLSGPLSRWMASPFVPDPFIPRSLLPRAARFLERVGGGFALLLGSSLAASIGALPFEIVHFHFVSLVGPVANLLIVPLAELVVTVGTLSLCFGALSSLLGALLNNANWLFVHALLATVATAARLPAAGIAVGDPRTLLSGTPGLRLLFPATPLGSACLVHRQGKVLLIEVGERGALLPRIDPIRRFYGWNWLDGAIRREGSSWWIAPRTPWGVEAAFAPMEQFSLTNTLCLQPVAYTFPKRGAADAGTALLFTGKELPLFVLCLDSPSGKEVLGRRQGTIDLLLALGPAPPRAAATPRPRATPQGLWLSLGPGGASLGELDRQGTPGKVLSLGRSAVEVTLEPGRIQFRPYRQPPLSYAADPAQEDNGATSQTPSSPEGSVQ